MLTMEQRDKCAKIAAHYEFRQEIVCMEECAELIQALCKLRRLWNDRGIAAAHEHKEELTGIYENIVEEMADVYVMLEQIRSLYAINPELIRGVADAKIARTLSRIQYDER